MTKVELLRHMLANVEAGRDALANLLHDGDQIVHFGPSIGYLLQHSDRFSIATRSINGFIVPAPMELKPVHGSNYFFENPAFVGWCSAARWFNDDKDRHRFAIGIYTTAEAAAANCKARYGINPLENSNARLCESAASSAQATDVGCRSIDLGSVPGGRLRRLLIVSNS